MSGLPSWSESRQRVERFEERHGPLMSEHEARSFVRGPQVTAMLRRAGIEIPEPPADALLRLCENFSRVAVEADYAWRQAALMRVSDDRVPAEEFDEVMNAVSATSLIAPHLADAQVILVDSEQIDALPDWPSREQALLALRDARLPFEVTFIDITAKLSGCPRIQTVHRDRDHADPFEVRWAGALLVQEGDGGVGVAPVATIHPARPEELSCPGVARFRREHLPGPLAPGEAWMVVGDSGEPEATFGVLPGGGNEVIRWQTFLAFTIAERCAMLLEVLNAPNVQLATRELHGKRARQADRAGHPLPRIIKVHRPVAADQDNSTRTGTTGRYSHQFSVRGHFAYYRRGPIYDANPSKRRHILKLGRDAVPVWHPPSVRGPKDMPYVPRGCSRIVRAIERAGKIGAGAQRAVVGRPTGLLAASLDMWESRETAPVEVLGRDLVPGRARQGRHRRTAGASTA